MSQHGYVKDLPVNPRVPRRRTPEPVDHASVDTEDLVSQSDGKFSPTKLCIYGALLMLVLFLFGNYYVIPAVTGISDNVQYGNARISSFDLNVGHGGTSHFIVQVYHGHVFVIEFDQPDYKGTLYTFDIEHSYDGKPVTLSLEDVNHDGKKDIVVAVEGDPIGMILYNTGNAFTTSR